MAGLEPGFLMSTLPIPLPITEATVFPGSVTVTLKYDYQSPTVTVTGGATWTYTRATLASLIRFPKFPCLGPVPAAPAAQFVAVQCARGRMPGWVVAFGEQPQRDDAIIYTQTNPGQSPVVTKSPLRCFVGMLCNQCAPGRRIIPGVNGNDPVNFVPSLNDGTPDHSTLVVEGSPVGSFLLDNPFALAGQTFSAGPDEQGLSVSVAFGD